LYDSIKRYEMDRIIGTKGQVVIEKAIREKLDIEPGTRTVQKVVDDHVEIYFLPAVQKGTLKGILAPHIKNNFSREEDLQKGMENVWIGED